MRNLRLYAAAAVLLAGCLLVWQTQSQMAMPLDASLNSVLPQIDGLDVEEQTLSEEERRVAGMTEYAARTYLRDSALVFSTMVSYYSRQTQGKTIHSPKNCLPGAGWEIMATGTAKVGEAQHMVNRYVLRNGRFVAIAYYWYQGRGRVTANEYAVKWNLLRDAALLGRTEEALVRVVIPVSAASMPRLTEGSLVPEDSIGRAVSARLIADVRAVLPTRGA